MYKQIESGLTGTHLKGGPPRPNVPKTRDGKWDYIEDVPDPPVGNNNYNPLQKMASKKGGDDPEPSHNFRSRRYHAVFKNGKWVVHRNQFESTQLFGLGVVPHALLEGRLSDLPFVDGKLFDQIDRLRWLALRVGTTVYDNRNLYWTVRY